MAHYFIGIHLPNELQEIYHHWQRELKTVFHYKRWTAREDFHITLTFLGNAEEKDIHRLTRKLEEISLPSFSVKLGGIGTFGNVLRPRVLFVEVELNDSLIRLQKQVAHAASSAGFSMDKRPYRPHVTLGKKWNSTQSLSEGKLQKANSGITSEQTFTVGEFVLFKIHLGKEPSYEKVDIFPLSK